MGWQTLPGLPAGLTGEAAFDCQQPVSPLAEGRKAEPPNRHFQWEGLGSL